MTVFECILCPADSCTAISKGTVLVNATGTTGGNIHIPLATPGLRLFTSPGFCQAGNGNMLLAVNTTCGGLRAPPPPPNPALIKIDWSVRNYDAINATCGDALVFNWRQNNGLMEISSGVLTQEGGTCISCDFSCLTSKSSLVIYSYDSHMT